MDHDGVACFVDGLGSRPVSCNSVKKSRRRRRWDLLFVFCGGFCVTLLVCLQFLFPLVSKVDDDADILDVSGVDSVLLDTGDEDWYNESSAWYWDNFTAPENSFGIGSYNRRVLNHEYLYRWAEQFIRWDCYGLNPNTGEWQNTYQGVPLKGNYFFIDKVWNNDSGFMKYTLNLTTPPTPVPVKYLVYFAVEKEVLSHVNSSWNNQSVLLNFSFQGENASLVYDWSDYYNTSEWNATDRFRGFKTVNGKEFFYMGMRTKNPVDGDRFFSIDPTFGETSIRDDYDFSVHASTNCYISGDSDTPSTSGFLISLTAYFSACDVSNDIQGAVYEGDFDNYCGDLVGVTETKTVGVGNQGTWVTFNFADSYSITGGTEYYICFRTTTDNEGNNRIGYDYTGTCISKSDFVPLSFDNPLTGESSDTGTLSVYATYVESKKPEFSNRNPLHNSYNQSINTVFNVTITEGDGNNSIVDFYISTDNTSWSHIGHNTSILNESVSVDLSGLLDYDTFYYLKVTANDTDGNNESFYSSFETTPYRSSFWNNSFSTDNWVETNSNCSIVNDGFVNFTYSTSGGAFTDDFIGTDGAQLSTEDYWQDGSGDYKWLYDDDGTPSSNTGADATALGTTPGTDYIYTEASSRYNKNYYLESDEFTGSDNIIVDFYYHMYGAGMGTLSVQIWDGSSWDTIWDITGQQHTTSSQAFTHGYAYSENGDSAPYDGTTKIRIWGLTGGAYTSDMCVAYPTVTVVGASTGYVISKNITKSGDDWDKLYAHITENESNATFSILDTSNNVLLSGLDGSGNDISSVSNGTIRIRGDFNNTLSLTSWNVSWSSGGEPPSNNVPVVSDETPTNNSIDVLVSTGVITVLINDTEGDTFNYSWGCSDGSSNSAVGNTNGTKQFILDVGGGHLDYGTVYTWWVFIDDGTDTVNYTFSFTTESLPAWHLVDNTLSGSIGHPASWDIIDNTLSGSISHPASWKLVDNTLSGSISTGSKWYLVDNTLSGSIGHPMSWHLVDNTMSGSISHGAKWYLVDNTLSGSISCNKKWQLVDNSLSGSINHPISWNNVDNTLSGSISHSASWRLVDNTLSGSISSGSGWVLIDNTLSGSISHPASWVVINNSINGSISNNQTVYSWVKVDESISGKIRNPSAAIIINITGVYPSDGGIGIPLQPYAYALFNHTSGENMNISWYIDDVFLGVESAVSNGTYSELLLSAISRSHSYTLTIKANASGNWQNESFVFRTEGYAGSVGFQPGSNVFGFLGLLGLVGLLFIFKKKKNKKI